MNVGELLREATTSLGRSGSETPRLDAELLLGHVLRVDRATLIAAPEAPVGDGAAETFQALVVRRAAGEPVAYIRGLKEFYGLALSVDRRALIPRPETELLVDLALSRVGQALTAAPRPPGAPPLKILDVGTGSGAIAIALAVQARRRGYATDVRIVATDLSSEALGLALENAVAHGLGDAIDFVQADLAAGCEAADLVLANLPYVPSAVVPNLPVAASFEPADALDGGHDGLSLIRRLLERLPELVRPGGAALLEIGSDQPAALLQAVGKRLAGWPVAIHPDLAGQARVLELGRPE